MIRKGKVQRKKKYQKISFNDLAFIINSYLLEDNLRLDLKGFRDALKRYFRVEDNQIDDVHSIMIECNLWYNYFSDIQALITYEAENWLLRSEWYIAHEKKAEPSEELESRIQAAKLRAKHYKMFSKHIQYQQKFFGNASTHCQYLYNKSIESLNRS